MSKVSVTTTGGGDEASSCSGAGDDAADAQWRSGVTVLGVPELRLPEPSLLVMVMHQPDPRIQERS
jgi:hypothetical protein